MGLEASRKETEREGVDKKKKKKLYQLASPFKYSKYFLKDLIENFNGVVKLKKLKDAYMKLRVFEVSKNNYKSVDDSRGLSEVFHNYLN
jgi:hypothetical protein